MIRHDILVLLHTKVNDMKNDWRGTSQGHGLDISIEPFLFQNNFPKTDLWKDVEKSDDSYQNESQRKKLEDCVSNTDNNNQFQKSRLHQSTREYVIKQFCEINVFDNGFEQMDYSEQSYDKEVFNNNFDELDELIQSIIKNIADINSYKINMSIGMWEESGCDSGIACFITNEWAYVMFHNLTMDSLDNKFIYNISCYICCYPYNNDTKLDDESYFDLQNEHLVINSKNKEITLTGTLLHCDRATYGYNKPYYDMLVKDGYDVSVYIRLNGNSRVTSYQTAPLAGASWTEAMSQV